MANTTVPNRSQDVLGTGRRKTAVARVRLRAGTGKITVNGRPFDQFFVGSHERAGTWVSGFGTEPALAPMATNATSGATSVQALVSSWT